MVGSGPAVGEESRQASALWRVVSSKLSRGHRAGGRRPAPRGGAARSRKVSQPLEFSNTPASARPGRSSSNGLRHAPACRAAMSWGSMRATSADQRASSSRASSARLESVWSRLRVLLPKQRQDGSASAVAGEGFVGVRRVLAPRLIPGFEVGAELGAGRAAGAGEESCRRELRRGCEMAESPSSQAPRSSFIRTVSDWSSSVCAVRMTLACPLWIRRRKTA